MIIGDPYAFSIEFDIVDEWNKDSTFKNGILNICVDGIILSETVYTSTLSAVIPDLIERLSAVKNNNEIFNMPKEQAFKHIYDLTYPTDFLINNDYSYDITPLEYSDNHFSIFMVGNGTDVRVLTNTSQMEYLIEDSVHSLNAVDIAEAIISKDNLMKMICKLKEFQSSYILI